MASSYFFLKALRRKRQRKIEKRNDETSAEKQKNNILSENYKCRICLKDGSVPIYAKNSCELSEAVKTFGNIEMTESDEFPKHLCNTCHSLLQGAILFRKSAKETDELLKSSMNSEIPEMVSDDEVDDTHDVANNYVAKYRKKKSEYNCKSCKMNYESQKEYLDHKRSKHRNVRIQCPICYGILTDKSYRKHLARHGSETHLVCEVCGKLYRKDNLVRHMQLHSFELPFQCQICPYRGRLKESLRIHMRTHTGDKPFSCEECQLHFLTRSNLNRHLLTHKKDRPFKCDECGRGFYKEKDRDIHLKSEHAGIKDFSCTICGNKFGTRKGVMRHELRVHKRDKLAKGRVPLYLQDDYKK